MHEPHSLSLLHLPETGPNAVDCFGTCTCCPHLEPQPPLSCSSYFRPLLRLWTFHYSPICLESRRYEKNESHIVGGVLGYHRDVLDAAGYAATGSTCIRNLDRGAPLDSCLQSPIVPVYNLASFISLADLFLVDYLEDECTTDSRFTHGESLTEFT